MGDIVVQRESNPGAIGANLTTIYVNTSNQLCIVHEDGVERTFSSSSGGNETVSGNLTVSGNATFSSNANVSGALTVTGNASAGNISTSGTLTVTGNATFNSNATISGNQTVSGTQTVTGNQTLSANATITGNLKPNSNGVSLLGSGGLGFKELFLDYTNTATVGNVTINKSSGRVNVAAAATNITVTNSLVTANSHVMAVASQSDTTGRVTSVVPASGSFTINCVAPTANMSVDFLVVGAD